MFPLGFDGHRAAGLRRRPHVRRAARRPRAGEPGRGRGWARPGLASLASSSPPVPSDSESRTGPGTRAGRGLSPARSSGGEGESGGGARGARAQGERPAARADALAGGRPHGRRAVRRCSLEALCFAR